MAVDDITEGMKRLQISTGEENALVPYAGDGAVVPYEAIKKRRPRPKVDLDQETNRLWNLLMGNEGSENADTMDEDNQKKWDEERRVFRGRVDSFIARMHLVQGIFIKLILEKFQYSDNRNGNLSWQAIDDSPNGKVQSLTR